MSIAVYYISLPQATSRRYHLQTLQEIIPGEIWPGVSTGEIHLERYQIKMRNEVQGTKGATLAHLNLYRHFLNHQEDDYLAVFEDDVYPHRELKSYWRRMRRWIENQQIRFKLLYLGVGDPASIREVFVEDRGLILGRTPKNLHVTGAFSVIIHRSVIPELIELCQESLEHGYAHDYHGLGTLQQRYNQESLMTQPHLVISDVTSSFIRAPRNQRLFNERMHWKGEQYHLPERIPLFILTNNNQERIIRFIQQITLLQPVVIPVFLIFQKHLRTKALFEQNQYRELLRLYLEEPKGISDALAHQIEDFMLQHQTLPYFGVTNTQLGWGNHLSDRFWPQMFKHLKHYDQVSLRVSRCGLCTGNPQVIRRGKYYQGMSFFKFGALDHLKDIGPEERRTFPERFSPLIYSTYSCSREDLGDLHNLTVGDLAQKLDPSDYLRPELEEGDLKWRRRWSLFFDRWWSQYLVQIINRFLPVKYQLEKIDDLVELEVDQDVPNNFNHNEFRIHRLAVQRDRNEMLISMGYAQMIPIFGKEITQELERKTRPHLHQRLSKHLRLRWN